jgi:CheY-like chemotaxis protein
MEPETQQAQEMDLALSSLLELAGISPMEKPSAQDVSNAVGKLKLMIASNISEQMLTQANAPGSKSAASKPLRTGPAGRHRNILIAGQLGIILHQLRQAINKLGGEVTLVKDMEAAIEQYKQQEYSLVIIDLFMPTEREGMIVLEEISRTNTLLKTNSQIIVLAPISKDNNLNEVCRTKGASHFLEKVDGWHNTILGIYMGEEPT